MSKSCFAFLLVLLLTVSSLATQAQTTWISGVTTSTTSTTATLTWSTAVPATTQVQYGLTASYGSRNAMDPALVTTHSATLGGLAAGTVYHLRLLSRDAEPLQLASIDYTITTQAGAVSVTVSPTSGTVASGASQQFTAQVKNATNTQVTWSTSSGSITSGGMFSAPVVTSDGSVTIVATSVADPSKSAQAVFTVKAPIQHSVSLNWQASPSKNVVFYSAYRSSMHGGPYALMASAVTGLAYNDLSVQAGTTYYYVVTATDNRGEESADSGEVSAVVPSP
jgi:uncharacterized protein YjdB